MTLFEEGSEAIVSVTAHYSDGSTAGIALGDCTYASDDEGVATVDTGLIEAVAEGTATITVSYKEGDITETDTIEVTVNLILLDYIVVLPKTMTLFEGEKESIKSVTAHYNDGSTAKIPLLTFGGGTPACEIESSDEAVATVLDTGLVTAVVEGTATITVSYTEGVITESDTIAVTVNPVLLTSIVVLPETMTLFVGEIEFFKVIAHYNNDVTKNVTNDCVFTLASVGTVSWAPSPSSDTRSIKALKVGKTIIVANYGGMTANIVVTVIDLVHNLDTDKYYHTIQLAIDNALTLAGHTIEVAPETYSEVVTVDVEELIIRGENLNAIVDGGFILKADNITIDGLTIKNGFGKKTRGIFTQAKTGQTFGSKGHQIINNEIFDIRYAINIVACGTESVNIVVDNNKIHDCRIAIMLEGYETTITNNKLYDNTKSGIDVERSCDNVITSNSIYDNGEYGIYFGGVGTTGNVVNYNNIYGNVDFGVFNASTLLVYAEDNWWGDASGPSGIGLGTGDAVSTHVDYIPWSTTLH